MDKREHKKIQRLRVRVETRLNRLCIGLQALGIIIAVSALGWNRISVWLCLYHDPGIGAGQIGVCCAGLIFFAIGKWAA